MPLLRFTARPVGQRVLASTAACAVIAALTLPTPAMVRADGAASTARGANPLVARGADEYEQLRYEEALQTLSAALVRSGNSERERAIIYRLLAFTYLALEREEEAKGAYRGLLALDPAFVPSPEVSPRFRAFFVRVHEEWVAEGRPGLPPPEPVRILHRSPAQAERRRPIALTAGLDDPGHRVRRLVLAYRQGTSDVYRRLDTESAGGRFLATIRADDVRPPLVEYYFEGLDDAGLPVASRGDVAAPLRIAVPEPSSSIFSEWWFYAGAAVIVGGAVTAAVLLSSDTAAEPPGTFVIRVQ